MSGQKQPHQDEEPENRLPVDAAASVDQLGTAADLNAYFGPPNNAPPDETPVDHVVDSIIMGLSKELYFHGSIGPEDVKELLKTNGDYFVRTPETSCQRQPDGNTPSAFCSVRWGDQIRDFPFIFLKHGVDGKERLVTLNGKFVKNSVQDLLKEHQSSKVPVENDIFLIRSIPRQAWELPKENLVLEVKIGEGTFATVWKGQLKSDKPDTPVKSVAVKEMKINEENKTKMDEIMIEARLMRQLQHINVVAFHGISSDNGKVMIVMELINGGSLNQHVKKNTNVSIADKCSYSFDVANGLAYLHEKRLIHRDMAARNCLIDMTSNIVKISDFGMSKMGDNYRIQANERTPIRWQAPEVTRTSIYSRQCDVYSFGMVLYEIFSNGKVPFEGVANAVIRQKIHDPSFRPSIPSDAPADLTLLMKATWEADPSHRPTMAMIVKGLNRHNKHAAKNVPGPVIKSKEGPTKSALPVRNKKSKGETPAVTPSSKLNKKQKKLRNSKEKESPKNDGSSMESKRPGKGKKK